MRELSPTMLCLSAIFSCAGLAMGCSTAELAIEQGQALPLEYLQKANKLLIKGEVVMGSKGFQFTVPEPERKVIISCRSHAQINADYDSSSRMSPKYIIRFYYFPDGRDEPLFLNTVASVKRRATAQKKLYLLPDEEYQKFRSIIEELIFPEEEWSKTNISPH